MKHILYLINLDESLQRLEVATNQLSTQGLQFKRLSAYDGRKTNPDDLVVYDRSKAYQYLGRAMVGGEMGCYFSHLDAAHQFLKSDASIGIVIEDDIRCDIDFVSIIQEAVDWLNQNGHADWELLNFGNQKLKISTPVREFRLGAKIYTLHKAHYFPMTTTGIAWSRAGAQNFIDSSQSIFAPVDNFLRHWQTRRAKGYSFDPPLVSTTGTQSLIDNKSSGMRRTNKRAINYYYAKQKRLWVDKFIAMRHKLRLKI